MFLEKDKTNKKNKEKVKYLSCLSHEQNLMGEPMSTFPVQPLSHHSLGVASNSFNSNKKRKADEAYEYSFDSFNDNHNQDFDFETDDYQAPPMYPLNQSYLPSSKEKDKRNYSDTSSLFTKKQNHSSSSTGYGIRAASTNQDAYKNYSNNRITNKNETIPRIGRA